MPAASAVSTRPVPLATCTSRSSTLTQTSSVMPCPRRPASRNPHETVVSDTGTCPPENLHSSLSRRLSQEDRAGCLTPRDVCSRPDLRGHGGVGVLIHRCEEMRKRRVLAERAAAVLEVRAELVAELRHAARDGHRRRVAEYAQALADDAVAHVEQHLEIVLGRASVLDRA